MSTPKSIIETFGLLHKSNLTIKEFYDNNPFIPKHSLRARLSEMVKKGQLNRIRKGVYSIQSTYKKFRHIKRIFDTHKSNPIHPFDLDIELSCEGYAPSHLSPDYVGSIVNPKLLTRSLEMLDEEGINLFEEIIDFTVIGTEDMGVFINTHISSWYVEVKLVNSNASQYVFNGTFNVGQNDW